MSSVDSRSDRLVDELTIQSIGARLRAVAPGATVILFGSYARGEASADSDLDVMVVKPAVHAHRRETAELLRAVRAEAIPVDVVLVSRANFDKWRDQFGSVIYEAANEGRVIGVDE